jgi:hypothetical protein
MMEIVARNKIRHEKTYSNRNSLNAIVINEHELDVECTSELDHVCVLVSSGIFKSRVSRQMKQQKLPTLDEYGLRS